MARTLHIKGRRPYKNLPLAEIALRAETAYEQGWTIYQRWTCENCGERVTGNEPNTLTELCIHEECGHCTDVRKTGCGFSAMRTVLPPAKH